MKRRGFLGGLLAAAAVVVAPPIALARKARSWFTGEVGHVVVFDHSLTDDEIKDVDRWVSEMWDKDGGREGEYDCRDRL